MIDSLKHIKILFDFLQLFDLLNTSTFCVNLKNEDHDVYQTIQTDT